MRNSPIPKIADAASDLVRREVRRVVADRNQHPLADLKIVSDVELVDATDKIITHNLGRAPKVLCTLPENPAATGRVENKGSASGAVDITEQVVIRATGFGATVTVDVILF